MSETWSKVRRFKPLRTAAQAALSIIGSNTVGVTDVDWVGVGSVSAGAFIITVLMALADGSTLLAEPARDYPGTDASA